MRTAFEAIIILLSAGIVVSAQGTTKHVDQTISGTGYSGAPYSARETTVNVRTSTDGVRYSTTNTSLLWRDAEGRTREEQSGESLSGIDYHSVTILDPVAGISLNWPITDDSSKRFVTISSLPERQKVTEPASSGYGLPPTNPTVPNPSPVPYGCPKCAVKSEFFGAQQINGILAVGWRTTRTHKAGTMDNGEDFVASTINETWTSPALRIEVRSISELPEMGKTTVNVTDIVPGDQDPALFHAPQGYNVRDMRSMVNHMSSPGGAAEPAVNELDGTWVNVDSERASLVQIVIDGLGVHPFGTCHPRPCDWGILRGRTFAASVGSSAVAAMTAQMETTFSEVALTLILEADGRLRVDDFTQFTDGSKRANYHHVDYLTREHPAEQPAAAVPIAPTHGNRTIAGSAQMWSADILIPPAFYAVQGAPFEALIAENRTPADPSQEKIRRFVRVQRDSQGRQRHEDLADADCPGCKVVPTSVRVTDPVGHRSIRLDPANKTAVSCPLPSSTPPIQVPASGLSDRKPDESALTRWLRRLTGSGVSRSGEAEPRIAGLQATVTRIPHKTLTGEGAGAQPEVVDELWTSPLYRMPVRRVIDDPGYGHIDLQVVHFKAAEPNESLFEIPKGYTVRTEADNACVSGTRWAVSRQ